MQRSFLGVCKSCANLFGIECFLSALDVVLPTWRGKELLQCHFAAPAFRVSGARLSFAELHQFGFSLLVRFDERQRSWQKCGSAQHASQTPACCFTGVLEGSVFL